MRDIDRQLFHAAREGLFEEVPGLVVSGADVDAKHPEYCDHGSFLVGFTPLMTAVASPRSNVETVRALIGTGADIFTVSDGEVSALWYAAGGGTHYPLTPENAAQLEEGHPFWDWGGGDVERLRAILEAGANPDEFADNGRTAVGEAAKVGDPARLRLLIEHGASVWPVPTKGRSNWPKEFNLPEMQTDKTNSQFEGYAVPLFQAAESGRSECVRLILEAGFPADFVCRGENALDHATSAEVAEVLWDAGVRIGSGNFGFDAVDGAFDADNFAVAEFLIGRMPEKDRAHYINEKLMMCAGVRMNPRAVRVLLGMGGNPNYESKTLGSPLHWCCWQGDGNMGRENTEVVETLQILIAAGADVGKRDPKRGSMPLHEAVQGDWGSPTSVRVLLEHGAEVDPSNSRGETPLMLAAEQGEVACIRLLLEAGANRSLKDLRGKSALDRAKAHAKVWQGIVRRPPGLVMKFVKKLGLNLGEVSDSHLSALADAEEAVQILSGE